VRVIKPIECFHANINGLRFRNAHILADLHIEVIYPGAIKRAASRIPSLAEVLRLK